MLPYWVIFTLASLAAIGAKPLSQIRQDGTIPVRFKPSWLFVISAITLFVGLRYQVGGDWYAYVRIFEQSQFLSPEEAISRGDAGYWALNYFVGQSGGSLIWVNLAAGLLFSIGTTVFCLSLPRPWLALAAAFPYVIIVVGMGYARQGVALGFVMVGLVALSRERFIWFLVWVAVGALFHKTAIVMIALGAASVNKNRFLWIPIIGIAGVGGYVAFLADYADQMIAGYIGADYTSSGALIRISMNLFPGMLFLIYRKRFFVSAAASKFWTVAALLSAALFLAIFAGVPSTALDRMALYLLPLQLFVFSHLPHVLGGTRQQETAVTAGILGYYALVLFVWLNFAAHSQWWIPYRIWPTIG